MLHTHSCLEFTVVEQWLSVLTDRQMGVVFISNVTWKFLQWFFTLIMNVKPPLLPALSFNRFSVLTDRQTRLLLVFYLFIKCWITTVSFIKNASHPFLSWVFSGWTVTKCSHRQTGGCCVHFQCHLEVSSMILYVDYECEASPPPRLKF